MSSEEQGEWNQSSSSLRYEYKYKMNSKSNVLECRVCEDVFGVNGDRIPRLLYCGHTVCHACLLRLPLRDSAVHCPFDRQPTPVGDGGVWGLKKNFALLELLERLQISQDRSAGCSGIPNGAVGSPGLGRLLEVADRQVSALVACDEDESHQAVVYCVVCGSHLCTDCSNRTHGTRTLARHRRVPLADKPRERAKCTTHPNHVAEFACLEDGCQQAPLMCFVCKDYGRHKNHKHGLVETEAEILRQSLQAAIAKMRQFMEQLGETVHKIEHTLQRMEGTVGTLDVSQDGSIEGAKSRVQMHFDQLRETLDLQQAAAMAALDAHVRERLCSLRQLQEDLTTSMSQVAAVCVQCGQLSSQDDSRLLCAAREIKEALDLVEQQQQQFSELSSEQTHPDPSIPITFTKDNRVHMGPRMEMRVVTLGLDGAGKTSVLFKLKQDEFVAATPTIGFNVESLEFRSLQFTVWDVGGQPKLRPLWKHYYLNTQAVVFVVDSSCGERLPEAQCELAKLLSEKELRDASLLILANKQDLENCVTVEEMTQQITLFQDLENCGGGNDATNGSVSGSGELCSGRENGTTIGSVSGSGEYCSGRGNGATIGSVSGSGELCSGRGNDATNGSVSGSGELCDGGGNDATNGSAQAMLWSELACPGMFCTDRRRSP